MNVFSYPKNVDPLLKIEECINTAKSALNDASIESSKLYPAIHPYTDPLISKIESAQSHVERLETLYLSLKGAHKERQRKKSKNIDMDIDED